MHKLWRKSSIGQLPEIHGHGFEKQNQLPINKKYSFECLQPMKPQDNVKNCDKRLICRICSGGHPTTMHGYVPKRKNNAQDGQRSNENEESVANNFTDLKTLSTVEKHQNVISMCIALMNVKSAARKKDVLAYVTLGSCGHGSFIQEVLVKKMQASGRKRTLTFKTLDSERPKTTVAIDRVQVAGAKYGTTWIKLTRIFTLKYFPIEKKEVATPKKTEEWDCLKTI